MEMKRKALAAAIAVATALTLTACGGSSGGGGGGTLKMAGGLGGADGGFGGDGDYFQVDLYSGGDIILGGGPAADTSFTPTNLNSIPTELGGKPLIVTSDLTLAYVAAFASKPAAGTYYLSGAGGGGYEIRLSDGDTAAFNAAEIVSGVEIARGATLTLSPNSGSTAWISPDYDVIVKGTLATAEVNATDVAGLRIDANSVLVHRSGVITTAGVQAGQNAGGIDIYPDYSFINQGQVLSHGADNDAGDAGDGDTQYVEADYYFENTGTMDAHGGDSETGFGGDAGWIDVYANYGDCVSSGKVFAHGGFGELGGGDGDDVYFYADSVGDVKVSGTVTFYGGDAGAGASANGGDADYMEFYSYGGGVYSNATLKGWGGSTASADGDGGDGGYISVYNYNGGHYETSPPMGVNFAGSIDMNGGNALASGTGDGGDADDFYVYVDNSEPTGQQNVVFHFGKIDMNGGDGNDGGDGGWLYVYNYEGYSNALDVYFPGGTNDIRWTTLMNGGDVVRTATGNGDGGDGGGFYIESDYYYASAVPEAGLAKVSGNIEMSGGESLNSTSTGNAEADYGWLWGYNGVTFANITARGGNDRATDGGTDGYGGNGASMELYSELGDIRGGRVDISAGNGEYQGGYADYFNSEGHMMNYALVANGGNADADLAGSTGGDVDDVYIWSQQGAPGVKGVSVTRKAGTGETAGDEDSYYMILGSTCTGLDC